MDYGDIKGQVQKSSDSALDFSQEFLEQIKKNRLQFVPPAQEQPVPQEPQVQQKAPEPALKEPQVTPVPQEPPVQQATPTDQPAQEPQAQPVEQIATQGTPPVLDLTEQLAPYAPEIDFQQPTYDTEEKQKPLEGVSLPWYADITDIGTQVVGGIRDTIEATLELGTDLLPDFQDADVLMFNFEGLENYNPNKPPVFFMDRGEFQSMYEDDTVTRMPVVVPARSVAGQFTRDMAQALSGMYLGSKTIGLAGSALKTAGVATKAAQVAQKSRMLSVAGSASKKAIDLVGSGAIGSMYSYKPYTPRLANTVDELMASYPDSVVRPFFQWLKADEGNTIAEERFKAALESSLLDVGVTTTLKIFKMFKREKSLLNAEAGGATVDELDELDRELIADVINAADPADYAGQKIGDVIQAADTADYKGTTPKPVEPQEDILQPIPGVTPVKDVAAELLNNMSQATEAEFKSVVKRVTGAVHRLTTPEEIRVFNTSKLQDLDARVAIREIGLKVEDELQATRSDEFGPKSLESITIDGMELYNQAHYDSVRALVDGTAEELGLDAHTLYKSLTSRVNSVVGLEADIHSYRLFVSQLGSELNKSLEAYVNDPTNVIKAAQAYNKYVDTRKFTIQFSELKRIVGRATTVQRESIEAVSPPKDMPTGTAPTATKQTAPAVEDTPITIPKNPTPEDLKKLAKELKKRGITSKQLALMHEVSSTSKNPLDVIKNTQAVERTLVQKGFDAAAEFYRGMLLASLKTQVAAFTSGVTETFITPAKNLVGAGITGDRETVEQVGHFMTGLFLNAKESLRWSLKSLAEEKNFVDPGGTRFDATRVANQHSISMDYTMDGSKWNPYNWVAGAVNFSGKVARGGLRLLGGQDEFFKQLNYRAYAYSQIMKNKPASITAKEDINAYVLSKMDEYFDPTTGSAAFNPKTGKYIHKDAIDYARKITYTEQAEGVTKAVYDLQHQYPVLKLVFPIVRTPANVFKRYFERTPVLNFVMKEERRKFFNGTPAERSEVVGNLALGMTLYTSAIGMLMSGKLTGGGPTDRDAKEVWRLAGNPEYSIKLTDDTWISYNRLDPSSIPFALVADLYENVHKYNDDQIEEASMAIIGAIYQAVISRSWMTSFRNLNNLINGANDPRFGKTLGVMAAGVIPPVIGEVGDFVETVNTGMPQGFAEALTVMEKIKAKARPLTGYDAVKHNWFTGERILQPSGHFTGHPITPGKVDPYIDHVARMRGKITPPSTKIGNIELTGKQYARLTELTGNLLATPDTVSNSSLSLQADARRAEAEGDMTKAAVLSSIDLSGLKGMTLRDALKTVMDSPAYNMDRAFIKDYDTVEELIVMAIVNAYKKSATDILLMEEPDLLNKKIQDAQNKASVMMGGPKLFELNQ